MRPGQNKRMRGRNPNNNSHNSNNGGSRKGPNPLTRSYESNGPDVKIRGNAHHVAEKYLQLARDAQSSGDPVAAESYLQHAEHYFRLIASAQQAQMGHSRPAEEVDDGGDDDDSGIPDRFASPQPPAPFVPPTPVPAPQPYQADRQPYAGDRQPYAERQNNGSGERQSSSDRQNFNGDRSPQPSQDRNGYDRSQRQDRNGMGRNRPYRETGERGPDLRNGERSADARSGEPGERQDRNRQNERPRYDRGQYDRSQQDRSYRDAALEQPRDPVPNEQPRMDSPERLPEPSVAIAARVEGLPAADVVPRVEAATRMEPAALETVPRDVAPRSEPPVRSTPVERPARPAPAVVSAAQDDGPGLPSFITTPTRVAPAESAEEPSLAGSPAFPGDDAIEAPKFPRRRRRTTRAAAGEAAEPAGETPVTKD